MEDIVFVSEPKTRGHIKKERSAYITSNVVRHDSIFDNSHPIGVNTATFGAVYFVIIEPTQLGVDCAARGHEDRPTFKIYISPCQLEPLQRQRI
jgi:hypothetical protein